ncbi:META domain-containing protein [Ruegeria arenilitoris]|uniref:META domain-containing protein n=1 Tax=Ruegeria arenilitoris TaxID=1173585 RepID=UPI00147A6670|nr:META domain-containing protein [Ruegeria arenilitoris]
MPRWLLILPLFSLFQCDKDETVAAYGAADRVWALQEVDGQVFDASALVRFPQEGRIAGNGPCNSYEGKLSAPYPWFEIEDLIATRASCAGIEAEGFFFAALMAMTQSEVSGNVLILRNDDGHEMVFKAVD